MANTGTGSRLVPALGIVLLLMLALAGTAWYLTGGGSAAGDDGFARQVATAQSITLRARDALAGETEAFDQIERRRASLPDASAIAALADGPNSESARRAWGLFTTGLADLVGARAAVLQGHDSAASVAQRVPDLLTRMGNFVSTLSPDERRQSAAVLERFEFRASQLPQDLQALAAGVGDNDATIARINAADTFINQVLRNFSGEDASLGLPSVTGEAASALDRVNGFYYDIGAELRAAIEAASNSSDAHRANEQIGAAAVSLYGAGGRSSASDSPAWLPAWLPYALLGGAGLAGIGMLFGQRRGSGDDGQELAAATEQNERNQQAILRLLDEMGSLADGDLTAQATVTEDITGAIADSINYAIEALRDLVSTIDSTASEVEAAAQQTEATASHLAKSSENQSKQVFAATESIANMAGSIEEVSGNAERSSDVARHSVEIAHKGGEAVRRTIDGMNTIRETIQDTSKRIKRLGESSQEIGNIVELINDIAEQTNILALNASIQASMAGEAGRGFAVVADEVQRLSERATNATKQIEVLVKTIQSDTNEAVVSMERSTTDVVSGALLAENAGAALDEIEKVSNQIASLVQNISGTARQQATAAADITRNMGVLQEISTQTAENTSAASRSIGNLAQMASELRRSVSGFTLPRADDAADESADGDARRARGDRPVEQNFIDADLLLAEAGND